MIQEESYDGFARGHSLFYRNVVFSLLKGAIARRSRMYMYTIKYKPLLAFFKCLLVVSSLVLFGNRLTDRFHLCTSMAGGLYRTLYKHQHPYPGHRELGVRYGKVLSSVDKRYHSPVGMGVDVPGFRVVPVTARAAHSSYVLPASPLARFYSGPSLRGPPAC